VNRLIGLLACNVWAQQGRHISRFKSQSWDFDSNIFIYVSITVDWTFSYAGVHYSDILLDILYLRIHIWLLSYSLPDVWCRVANFHMYMRRGFVTYIAQLLALPMCWKIHVYGLLYLWIMSLLFVVAFQNLHPRFCTIL
jgi:hypothetical protein